MLIVVVRDSNPPANVLPSTLTVRKLDHYDEYFKEKSERALDFLSIPQSRGFFFIEANKKRSCYMPLVEITCLIWGSRPLRSKLDLHK